jgi:hypothetical protein
MVSIPPNPSRSVKHVPRPQVTQTVSPPSYGPVTSVPAPELTTAMSSNTAGEIKLSTRLFEKFYEQYNATKSLHAASKEELEAIRVSSDEFDDLVVKKDLAAKLS